MVCGSRRDLSEATPKQAYRSCRGASAGTSPHAVLPSARRDGRETSRSPRLPAHWRRGKTGRCDRLGLRCLYCPSFHVLAALVARAWRWRGDGSSSRRYGRCAIEPVLVLRREEIDIDCVLGTNELVRRIRRYDQNSASRHHELSALGVNLAAP